jgi:hypothetical protein
MAKAAPPYFAATQEADSTTKSISMAGQQAPVTTLNAAFTAYRFIPSGGTLPTETYLLVDLTNTSVSPGVMQVNRADKKGFYTEGVHVRFWVEPNSDDGAPFLVRADAPASAAEGGSVSNSTTYSVSGGFFSTDATGQGDYSISSSVSQTTPDFETVNNTGASGRKIVDHQYLLRLVGGARYGQPPDIVDPSSSGSIRNLPPRATSDFPVISSAMFHLDSVVIGVRRVQIEITHRLMMVEKTYQIPDPFSHPRHYDPTHPDSPQSFVGSATLGQLLVETTPSIRQATWMFDVDFSGKTVDLVY